MALFGKTKKTATKTDVVNTQAAAASPATGFVQRSGLSHVITRPRITEKATMHGASGVYTFDVAAGANKREIIEAVRSLYKVTPRKISILNVPSKVKRSPRTGKIQTKGGGKKAYVYLKKGETLQIN